MEQNAPDPGTGSPNAEKARLYRLNLRLTRQEWDRIHRLAANSTCRSTSEYARKLLSQKPVRVFYRNQSFDDFEEQMVRLLPELRTANQNFAEALKTLAVLKSADPAVRLELFEAYAGILLKTVYEIRQQIQKLSDNETKNYQLQQHSQVPDLQRTETHTGKAECLTAANFLKDPDQLTYADKLHRFQRRMELNEAVRTSQHITLNFDPSDQLSNEKMKQIADTYMKEIGFENQPYLVYRHHDAGHPHCHIVTTHVRSNGDPIEMYNIGKNQSEQARLRIEKEYQLMTGERKQQLRVQQWQTGEVQKITYGESSTTQSISRVLDYVTEKYNYTTLEELNTVLRLYNVEAYRGREDSKLYQNRGLLYRVLDGNGRYIGVPLKASFFDSKPTLDNLERKMTQNQTLKLQHQQRLENSVLWNLYKNSDTMEQLKQKMAADKIRMILHRDKQGICRDVFYIDFENKCIYNGSELHERCNHLTIQKIIDRQTAQKLEQSQNQDQNQTQRQAYRLRHLF